MVIEDITFQKVLEFAQPGMKVLATDGKTYYLSGGTLAWRHNNPGNLKFGDFARNFGALSMGYGGHAVFATYADGAEAQRQLLFSREGKYFNLTIQQAINKYAPVSDPNPAAKNDPPAYAKFIAEAANVSTDTVLIELSDRRKELLLKAMREFEGYKVGSIEEVI